MEHLNSLTEKELIAVNLLRDRVHGNLYQDYMRHDGYLIRWLRYYNRNVPRAESALLRHLEWRKSNEVDTLLDREQIPEVFQVILPLGLCGAEPTTGLPVFLLPVGNNHAIVPILKIHGVKKCLMWYVACMEKMMMTIRTFQTRTDQMAHQCIEIIDLEVQRFLNAQPSPELKQFYRETRRILQNHYPEVTRWGMTINSPGFFRCCICIAQLCVSRIKDKGTAYGRDKDQWKAVLRQHFDMQNIPVHWGGSRYGTNEWCSTDMQFWLFGCIPINHFKRSAVNERDH